MKLNLMLVDTKPPKIIKKQRLSMKKKKPQSDLLIGKIQFLKQ